MEEAFAELWTEIELKKKKIDEATELFIQGFVFLQDFWWELCDEVTAVDFLAKFLRGNRYMLVLLHRAFSELLELLESSSWIWEILSQFCNITEMSFEKD